jgi:hypothetical protein
MLATDRAIRYSYVCSAEVLYSITSFSQQELWLGTHMKLVAALLLALVASAATAGNLPEQKLRKALGITPSVSLTDKVIRDAVLRLAPLGSRQEDIFRVFMPISDGCAPGEFDGSQFDGMAYCSFDTPHDAKGCDPTATNYWIFFDLNSGSHQKGRNNPEEQKLQDIKVHRWKSTCPYRRS